MIEEELLMDEELPVEEELFLDEELLASSAEDLAEELDFMEEDDLAARAFVSSVVPATFSVHAQRKARSSPSKTLMKSIILFFRNRP